MIQQSGTDPLESFARLEEAATFFLYRSFEHAYAAALLHVAATIFGESIMKIEPEAGFIVPPVPTTLPKMLRELTIGKLKVISDETASKLANAWEEAQDKAPKSGRTIGKAQPIESIEIAGHVIDLAVCIESVVNRHLFLLRESGKLEKHLYASLDRTEVVPKILFAFKDQIQTKRLSTSHLVQLFRLRNEAVHFKATSAVAIKPTFEELLGIWREVGQLLELVEGSPTRQQLDKLMDTVISKWVK